MSPNIITKSNFKKDLSDSANAFINVVWPVIKRWLKNCQLRSVEVVDGVQFAEELDQYSGIDAWVLDSKKGMRGLASRVQWGKAYNTFTIRRARESGTPTEYIKRKQAIESNWLYPYYTIQAYISKRGSRGKLLSVACCKTKDLFAYIEDGIPQEEFEVRRVEEHGASEFFIISWDAFNEIYPLDRWDSEKGYNHYESSLDSSLHLNEHKKIDKLGVFF